MVAMQALGSSDFDLVSFDKPPVAEVALSFQFASNAVDLDVLAAFTERVRPQLPVRQLHPVLPPLSERFDTPPVPTFEFHVDPPAVLPRAWFLSEDGTELAQLQHDRLSLNWRRLDLGGEYPRYDQLRSRFAQLMSVLAECVEALGRPQPGVSLCEVLYVNPIEAGPHDADAGTDGHPDLANVINRLNHRPSDAFLPEAEDAQLNARWRIPGTDTKSHEPVGRLYLSAAPGLRPPANVPIYVVNLTAHVLPIEGDAWGALDLAHRWVVLGFKDVTTDEMHKIWNLREETP